MQNTFVMRGFNASRHLSHQNECAMNAESSLTTQEMMKRLALHILHHEIEDAFWTLAEVRHVNDVRMADGSSRARLALETRDGLALLHVFI